jgi:cobalamin biosynthesis Mg chelatase CobN|tara:strand:- start:52 stop:309 length:258 start_codon:yes stop_codon:yes gene_type:complete
MKVKDYLNKVKANRYTYNNLDKNHIKDFQKLYNYLKTQQEKNVSNYFQYCDAVKGQVNFWLTNKNELDYIKKYKSMEIISQTIKH